MYSLAGEVGKMLQASLWSQLTLEVGSRERGVARGEPGQKSIVTQTQLSTVSKRSTTHGALCSARLTRDKVAV